MNKGDFINRYSKIIDEKKAAVFVGAGLSVPAGFVDWNGLIAEYAAELNLSEYGPTQFPGIIQYYIEKYGNRNLVIQDIIEKLCPKNSKVTKNHQLLSVLPIETYWTTNYDCLLEKCLEAKGVRVITNDDQIPYNIRHSNIDIIKMHGDEMSPDDIVISQVDYNAYTNKRPVIADTLASNLREKTFLFLGYSFNDPNLEMILFKNSVVLQQNQRTHYCIFRKNDSNGQQSLKISELRKYHIEVVLIDEYSDITGILESLIQTLDIEKKTYHDEASSKCVCSSSGFLPIIGRDREKREIISELQNYKSIYIWGEPGVGKTILATAIYEGLPKDQFKTVIDYFYSPEDKKNFNDILNFIAQKFNKNDLFTLEKRAKLSEIKKLLQENWPTLIYIDNADDVQLIEELTTLLPFCTLLITSRIAINMIKMINKELQLFSRNHSVELFKRAYHEGVSPGKEHYLNKICDMLGDLPLIIDICAHRASVDRLPIEDLPKLLEHYPEFFYDKYLAVIRMTYERLTSNQKIFFSMLNLFNGRDFDLEVIIAQWGGHDALGLLSQLRDLSLIKTKGMARYYLHPVIQIFTKGEFQKFSNKNLYIDRMIEYYINFCEVKSGNPEALEIEIDNIVIAMKLCYSRNNVLLLARYCELMVEMKDDNYYAYGFLPQKGYWEVCLWLVGNCLKLMVNYNDQARLNGHMGFFYYLLGDHKNAMIFYQKALDFYVKNDDFHGQAVLLHRIGFIQSDEGQYEHCKQSYMKSLAIAENHALSEEVLATSIHLVGVIHYHQGDYKTSEEYLLNAIQRRTHLKKGLSVTQRRLAATYRKLGKTDLAEDLLKEALEYDRSKRNERNIARTLRQIGMVHLEKNEITAAIDCFEQSRTIFQKIGNIKGISSVLTNIGQAYFYSSMYDEAEENLIKGLEMAEQLKSVYGIAINSSWLSSIYLQKNNYLKAIKFAERAVNNFQMIGNSDIFKPCKTLNLSLVPLTVNETCKINLSLLPGLFEETRFKYDEFWKNSIENLQKDMFNLDSYLDSNHDDKRRGISLILKPSSIIIDRIETIKKLFSKLIPNQYMYKKEDFHITLSTLISAREQFDVSSVDVFGFCEEFKKIMYHYRHLPIHFKGVTATNSCVLIKGYFPIKTLDVIRNRLKEIAPTFGMNTEERYANVTAHITIIRFCSEKDIIGKIVPLIELLSEYEIGIDLCSEIEFVINDWYMKKENRQILETFKLGSYT